MKRCAVVGTVLLYCASVAVAQTGNKDKTFSSTLSGGINLRSIAGAPFSADIVKESVKVLPDGTTMPVVTRGKMFRDSEGRTRSEMEVFSPASGLSRRFVVVVDPAAGTSIMLDAQAKVATVTALPVAPPQHTTGAGRISAKALAIVGAEDLGPSMLQGFSVTGSRRTRLAAGQSGGKAQSATVETWFSPELKIELQARTEAPGGNVTTTRLENIVMAEPDRALFEPPADYTVKTISSSK